MALKPGKAVSGPPAKFPSAVAAMLLQTETKNWWRRCVCLPETEKLPVLRKNKCREGAAEPGIQKPGLLFLSPVYTFLFLSPVYTCVNKIGGCRPTTFRTTLHFLQAWEESLPQTDLFYTLISSKTR